MYGFQYERKLWVFNYGETLRIRRDLYTILGKIRYIDTHGKIGYEYKLVKHRNNAEILAQLG